MSKRELIFGQFLMYGLLFVLFASLFTALFGGCEAIEGMPDEILAKVKEANVPKDSTYTVTFDINYGSGTVHDPMTAKAGDTIQMPSGSGLTKDEFAFDGWNTKPDSSGKDYPVSSSLTVTKNITLYVNWSTRYTVSFNANGATSGTAPAPRSESLGISITLPDHGNLQRTNYTFGGWNELPDGSGKNNYGADDNYSENASAMLYARWYVTVSFNGNGSTGGMVPDAMQANAGSGITLPEKGDLKRDGFTFSDWNTQTDGLGTKCGAGTYYPTPTNGNTTLFARWSSTITFDGNGQTSGAAPAAMIVYAGSFINLPDKNTLKKTGYTFAGWNTDEYGSGTNYNPGDIYYTYGDATLYANWDPTCTVTFDSNGGSGTIAPVTVNSGTIITLPGPGNLSYPGFTFDGWNRNSDGSGENFNVNSPFTVNDNTRLYARWSSTITFDGNGQTGGTAPVSMIAYANSDKPLLPDQGNLEKASYVFGGWNKNPDGSGDNYIAGGNYRTQGTTTLYAKWNFVYTVTFNPNYPTGGTAPETMYAGAGTYIILPDKGDLVKTDYSFDGWNTVQNGGPETNHPANSSYQVNNNTTFFANWSQTFTVSFNLNGAAGTTPASKTVDPGYPVSLPNPGDGNFSRPGYTFDGWNEQADGLGINHPGDSFSPTASVTLYARWTSTVTFDLNIVTVTPPASQTVIAGQPITLPDVSMLSTIYYFDGWRDNPGGTGTKYGAGAPYKPTGNTILYAKWGYSVTFDTSGGSSVPMQIVDPGAKVSEPTPKPNNGTYTLEGWYRESSYTTKWNFTVDTVTANISLYARWTSTVTFDKNSNTESSAVGTTDPNTQSVTVTAGSSITLPLQGTLTMRGYTFGGWNTSSAGTGTNRNAGDSWTPTGNITLYVKWDKVTDVFALSGMTTLTAQFGWLDNNALSNTSYNLHAKVTGTSEKIKPRSLTYSGSTPITINLTGEGTTCTITPRSLSDLG